MFEIGFSVRNEEVRMRDGIKKDLAIRSDQRVLS